MADEAFYDEFARSETLQPLHILRLLQMVSVEAGCWLWAGHRDKGGYGKFSTKDRCLYAHRVSYEHFVGPIADGLELDHLCRNRACINPEHLEPVTSAENTRRGLAVTATNARKTHCVKGHPFDDENTHYRLRPGRKDPDRVCRACERDKCRRARERRKSRQEGGAA